MLSQFEITAKLGEGGMGGIHRATNKRLGRHVALEILPEAMAADPERLEQPLHVNNLLRQHS